MYSGLWFAEKQDACWLCFIVFVGLLLFYPWSLQFVRVFCLLSDSLSSAPLSNCRYSRWLIVLRMHVAQHWAMHCLRQVLVRLYFGSVSRGCLHLAFGDRFVEHRWMFQKWSDSWHRLSFNGFAFGVWRQSWSVAHTVTPWMAIWIPPYDCLRLFHTIQVLYNRVSISYFVLFSIGVWILVSA